jgi:signal-transduction protein with cAMP-binding, CBS, and nucleotidyltransferase domain
MTCPDCGHDNIGGVDLCEHCGQDLRSIDIPTARSGLQRTIMETPLRDLNPLPAVTAAPTDSIAKVVRLMRDQRQGSVLVMEGGRLAGIFTERDALNKLTGSAFDPDRLLVKDVMTRDPKTLRDEDTLAVAMHCMKVGSYRHIPIVAPGKPPRFISVRGVLRFLNEHAR